VLLVHETTENVRLITRPLVTPRVICLDGLLEALRTAPFRSALLAPFDGSDFSAVSEDSSALASARVARAFGPSLQTLALDEHRLSGGNSLGAARRPVVSSKR
jgi:hypothetical protein